MYIHSRWHIHGSTSTTSTIVAQHSMLLAHTRLPFRRFGQCKWLEAVTLACFEHHGAQSLRRHSTPSPHLNTCLQPVWGWAVRQLTILRIRHACPIPRNRDATTRTANPVLPCARSLFLLGSLITVYNSIVVQNCCCEVHLCGAHVAE